MENAVQPYLFFYGRCEEALEFYKHVFDGRYDVMRVADSPMAAHMPPDAGDRVMHASFTAEQVAFLASDGRQVKAVDPEAGNIDLALTLHDGARGERIFDALAQGGHVHEPLDAAFWGGRFGRVTDKFGTAWLMVLPEPQAG